MKTEGTIEIQRYIRNTGKTGEPREDSAGKTQENTGDTKEDMKVQGNTSETQGKQRNVWKYIQGKQGNT